MTEECCWKGEGKVQNVPMVLSVGREMEGMAVHLPGILFFQKLSSLFSDMGKRQKEKAASLSWNLDIWSHLGPPLTLPGPQPALSITSLSFSRLSF